MAWRALTEAQWQRIRPHLPREKRQPRGGPTRDAVSSASSWSYRIETAIRCRRTGRRSNPLTPRAYSQRFESSG